MAIPSRKSASMDQVIKEMTGVDRLEAITEDVCIPKPIGCGGPAKEFRDEISKREYTISGLCQKCQDLVFGTGEE